MLKFTKFQCNAEFAYKSVFLLGDTFERQVSIWTGGGPPCNLSKDYSVRDARGSYIMFTGPLLHAPLTDTLTRHFDTMTK